MSASGHCAIVADAHRAWCAGCHLRKDQGSRARSRAGLGIRATAAVFDALRLDAPRQHEAAARVRAQGSACHGRLDMALNWIAE
jgi:hypothetical protein